MQHNYQLKKTKVELTNLQISNLIYVLEFAKHLMIIDIGNGIKQQYDELQKLFDPNIKL